MVGYCRGAPSGQRRPPGADGSSDPSQLIKLTSRCRGQGRESSMTPCLPPKCPRAPCALNGTSSYAGVPKLTIFGLPF